MKIFLPLAILTVYLISPSFKCNKDPDIAESDCIKAKLEIKGICGQYVIKVLEGDIDPAKFEASWTDPSSGKTYYNVFTLANTCDFPRDINEGDEFYFKLVPPSINNCVVCQAYRPTPSTKNYIMVMSKPCI